MTELRVQSEGFSVAHATGGDWKELTEACLLALGKSVKESNLGFVYVSDSLDEDLHMILKRLKEATRIHDWVGTIGFGVCVSGAEFFDMPAMALMVGMVPPENFCILPTIRPGDRDLPLEVLEWARKHHPVFGIIHADPRVPGLEKIFSRIQGQTHSFLVGGMTASRGSMDQIAGEVTDGGVSGILFGSDIGVATGLTQGCSPIGSLHRVSRGRDNIILALDGQPAFEVFKEDIGELLARDLSKINGYVHAALPVIGSDTGDYVVRNLLGVYPEKGWVSIGERIAAGDQVMFVRRDGAAAKADLEKMVSEVKVRAGRLPRAAFYFTCVARGPNLFGPSSVELATISKILGEDVPLIGFFANGEISNSRLYGYTGILAIIH